MVRIRPKGEQVRNYILLNVVKHADDIARRTAQRFNISRQAANKHLQRLVAEGALLTEGNTRSRKYKLAPLAEWDRAYRIGPNLAEDVVWRNDVALSLGGLPENVLEIWHYGFTEMFNNAIDHSAGSTIDVRLKKTPASTDIVIHDDGVGIFHKIQEELALLDERQAIFELAKGKLTTDPSNHSGEGIFFTSRAFDSFKILSGGTYFSHLFGDEEDWILEPDRSSTGTSVWMRLENHTARRLKKVFDRFAGGEGYGFNKTVVPVRLAQYGNDKLVSRSQAKRLLARIDRFKSVIFDFEQVDVIGQSFADEIFRVFARKHPHIELLDIGANRQVRQMIARARGGRTSLRSLISP